MNTIKVPQISLPTGGGAIKGIGETFQPNSFSGTGTFSIPILLSAARALTPELSMTYNAATGNGAYGLGFSLVIPSISIRTDKGLPRYDGNDTYIIAGSDHLVPKLAMKQGRWEQQEESVEEEGTFFQVKEYRPRVEGLFVKIEHWIQKDGSSSHWKVTSNDNTVSIYGLTTGSRITNPKDNKQIFQWMLEEVQDVKGNKVLYEYKQEDNNNIPNNINENYRTHTANIYPHKLHYGNYFDEDGIEKWAFQLLWDYGEYDQNDPLIHPNKPKQHWLKRKDSFSSYRAGFEIRTHRLCRSLMLFHHFQQLGNEPCLVRTLNLDYDENEHITYLTSVQQVGYKKTGGKYLSKSIPPIAFKYTDFKPEDQNYQDLSFEGKSLPAYNETSQYLPVDLYGEGIAGILYNDRDTSLYFAPLGHGRYAAPEVPLDMPIDSRNNETEYNLMDLGSDGTLDLVVHSRQHNGFYAMENDRSWDQFRPFDSWPLNYYNQGKEVADLVGDGLADILVNEGETMLCHFSMGKSGYQAGVRVNKENEMPSPRRGSEEEIVLFTNLFGDGLDHRVRVSNGLVECWPNLGYGRFGPRILLENPPRVKGQMEASRLYFADIDGSGTTDILYLYSNHVDIFFNQSGNSFSDPIRIPLPERFDQIDKLSFADILGNGTSCMVLTYTTPESHHKFYDFSAGVKPHLMVETNNNMGAVSRIRYKSSTEFYLEDKKNGKPWVTILPFPVQVIEKTETIDQISGTKLVTRFAYHHGHYDGREREFHGFGLVERWDTEAFEEYNTKDLLDIPFETTEESLHAVPIYSKTWYHTGVFLREHIVSKQYEKEYFQGDSKALLLPDSSFETAADQMDLESLPEAYRAMKGSTLREEVYGLDKKNKLDRLYTVSEKNLTIRLIQPKMDNKFASYLVLDQEAITYHYEYDLKSKSPPDPRMVHEFNLSYSPFGNLKKSCTINYGRRNSGDPNIQLYPEQSNFAVTIKQSEFIEIESPFRMISVPYEEQAFEVAGLTMGSGQLYFDRKTLVSQINEALSNQIDYDKSFKSGRVQARLFSWVQSYFWDPTQSSSLSLGQCSERALLHHQQHAVFTDDWLQQAFNNKPPDTFIEEQGGYFKEDNGYWWNKGLIQHYFKSNQPEKFFLAHTIENSFALEMRSRQTDGLKMKSTVAYDQPYFLNAIKTVAFLSETEKNVTSAEMDYITMSPRRIIDPNKIIHQVLNDPLGMVIATSVFKEATTLSPRTGDGDLLHYQVQSDESLSHILDNRTNYLQKATSYFFYDLFAFKYGCAKGICQPPFAVSLLRETHVSNKETDRPSRIRASVLFSDGFGRELEKKLEAEPGEAFLRDDKGILQLNSNGEAIKGITNNRWRVSGWKVLNNKGNTVKEYLPYFSNTPFYEEQKETVEANMVPPPMVTHYDPLQRAFKVDTPKGFFSKVIFNPWEIISFDENDTVKESTFYKTFLKDFPVNASLSQKNEKDALDKTTPFYKTPSKKVLDVFGLSFLNVQNNLGAVSSALFAKIVSGSTSSSDVQEELLRLGYLKMESGQAFVSSKFQAYREGFKAQFRQELAADFQPFAEDIIDLLRQSCLTSFHKFDIQGREIEATDPRLYFSNISKGTKFYNFKYQYFMGDEETAPSVTDSVDAGTNQSLNNIFGNLLWNLSPRNFDQITTFDRLQRKSAIRTKGFKNDGTLVTDNVVETFVYGESQTNAAERNLRGKLFRHTDQSGEIIVNRYNLLGDMEESSRQFAQDYKDYLNWSEEVPMEKDENGDPLIYKEKLTYNAFKQKLTEEKPDGSLITNAYNIAGLLEKVKVVFNDGTEQQMINQINYDAKVQRINIAYGNGVKTTYTYEPSTLRLTNLRSSRKDTDKQGNIRNATLQNIEYAYDPIGNITRTFDHTHKTVFNNNQKVEPLSEYTYDALYRLIEAKGRKHPGINARSFQNNSKDGNFKQSKFIPLAADANKLENYREKYSYDEVGNLIQTAHIASNSWTRQQGVMENSNRIKTLTPEKGISPEKTLSYNNSGNQNELMLNSTINLTWNCCENLVKASIIERPDNPDDADYYTYDSDEMRTRKIMERMINDGAAIEKEEKKYLGDYEEKQLQIITSDGAQSLVKRQSLRIMDDERCIAIIHFWEQDDRQREVDQVGSRSVRFQLDDHLGSASLEVDEDAQLISYEEYFPYGGTAFIAGKTQKEVKLKEYRYSGKERDDGTGLYYYGARYYAPWLGRWLKPDPAGRVDGMNLYAFVGGNPISHSDSTGLALKKISVHGVSQDKPKRHAAMNARFYAIGQRIGKDLAKRHPTPADIQNAIDLEQGMRDRRKDWDFTAQSHDAVNRAIDHGLGADKERFGATYRGAHPGMDEHLSTSTTFHLLRGIGSISLNATVMEELKIHFSAISHMRTPTGMTGYSTSFGTMQHPTAPALTMFGRPGENHGYADRLRRQEVLHIGENSSATGLDLLHEMAAAATKSTLGGFMGPATSSSMSVLSGVSQTDQEKQVAWREQSKDDVADMEGVTMTTSAQPMSAPWSGDYTPAPPSPRRMTQADKTW